MLGGFFIPLFMWVGLSVYHRRLEAMPESVLVIMGMALGLKGVDKALATRLSVAAVEKDKPPAPEPVPPAQPTNIGVQIGANEPT